MEHPRSSDGSSRLHARLPLAESGRISVWRVQRSRLFSTGSGDRELDYRLIKELWGFRGNRMAVRFAYEYHDDSGQWFRAYGNENWQFDTAGLMELRFASINEHPIGEAERKFHGRRPDDHPGLTALGL